MPSIILATVSGGAALVSGAIYSGQGGSFGLVGGVQLKLSKGANSGFVYVGFIPNITGGSPTGVSGGLGDGMELGPGDTYFVPRLRLTSGVGSIRVAVPDAMSGSRLFWEAF